MSLMQTLTLTLVAGATLAGCAALVDARATRREAGWLAQLPPQGALVQVEGSAVHVVAQGQARAGCPDIVLIHGASGNLRDMTFDLAGRLSDRYRVYAVDRPGHGWSPSRGEADSDPAEQARLLRAALAQMGAGPVLVVGHSYGGAVAMAWALQDAQTAGVVLLAGATHPWPGGLGPWYRVNATPLGLPARALVTALAGQGAIDAAVTGVFAPDPVPQGYAEHFGPGLSLQRAALAANTRQVNALHQFVSAQQPRYAGLTLPIEIIHGTADTAVGLEIHSRRMVAEVASAHLTVLEGVGHMPHHARPDAVTDAIDRAVARATGGTCG